MRYLQQMVDEYGDMQNLQNDHGAAEKRRKVGEFYTYEFI